MGSIKAQIMARKVSESLRTGKKKTYGEIALESGYAKLTSLRPSDITNTKAYKQAFTVENRPLLDGIQKEINEIKIALASKNKMSEEYRVLIGSMDILIKNYQLLSGGATERQVFVLPSEVIARNAIDIDVKSIDGSTEP